MPDAGRTREPCVQKKCTLRTQATTGQPKQPASPAQWFTAYRALSSVSRASLPPSPADVVTRELDPSIGRSGPRAFAVRDAGARLAPSVASTASRRNVRDVRTPLLSGGTGELVVLICPTAEAKSCPSGYFVASPRDEAIRRPRPSTSVAVQESPLRNRCRRCNGRAPNRSIWRRLAAFTSLIQVTPRDS